MNELEYATLGGDVMRTIAQAGADDADALQLLTILLAELACEAGVPKDKLLEIVGGCSDNAAEPVEFH